MNNPLAAIDPRTSATVSASAGTGKTWLLVSRIIRLLLAGAKPDAILAITFTRKAAAEMQTRLARRLFEFAAADDVELIKLLQQIQAPTDHATLSLARELYEDILHSNQKVRASTFHSFCQDILRRFPLDAGIAPGFELVEDNAPLRQEAWDSLVREATQQTEDPLAKQLDALMDYCNGLTNTQDALLNFLEHRSDWWAFTEGQASPVEFAISKLKQDLDITSDKNPLQSLTDAAFCKDVAEFVQLLAKHPTQTNQSHIGSVYDALESINTNNLEEAFIALSPVFLTKDGNPLARKESKTLAKKMGEAGQSRFLSLHHHLCTILLGITNQRYRLNVLKLCCTWYEVGQYFLERYQQIKEEQRILDFADLEWQTYNLLTRRDNAHWVQYKLDQRIDHLLIDEFQDTNPTQWQLIIPLLEELAAANNERQRSVFLVGDHKQSIYRFRRAAPELFDAAEQWLQQSLNAVSQPLSISWRSAPAIMQCVNWVFADGPLNQYIHQFTSHDTHRKTLWGQVEVMPLVKADTLAPGIQPGALRNPLHAPRPESEDTRHYEEGKQIAAKIKTLITQPVWIEDDGRVRQVSYEDIMILLRHRTHANAYETALREARIPYIGAERGTLLDTLESRDMVALLETLVTPYNNLALATVLRSPLFSCSNEQLMLLAELKQGTWLQRLQAMVRTQEQQPELLRAHRLLSDWGKHAGLLPVHDLLDRIYSQGNVLNRYEAAYPPHLKGRVRANLTRFIELALEVDSGRYPSIGNFLSKLKSLRDQTQNGPDEAVVADTQARVRIMTIHASKGMEAPVVFLADATNTQTAPKAYSSIVDWPAQQKRPHKYLIAPPKKQQDTLVQNLLAKDHQGALREEANLLYVAMTRAKQLLFISGCAPNRGDNLGWYGRIREQLRFHMGLDDIDDEQSITVCLGEPPQSVEPKTPAEESVTVSSSSVMESALKGPFPKTAQLKEIAPSYQYHYRADVEADLKTSGNTAKSPIVQSSDTLDEDKQTKGNVIHRILQLLCEGFNEADIIQWIRAEYGLNLDTEPFNQWVLCAKHVLNHPTLQFLYNPKHYLAAYNEVPLMYQDNGDTVYGFIDRLVVTDHKVFIVDYKTHNIDQPQDIDTLTKRYTPQLNLYRLGVTKCWKDKTVECFLLFTHNVCLQPVPISH